jgi:hypothetical protein
MLLILMNVYCKIHILQRRDRCSMFMQTTTMIVLLLESRIPVNTLLGNDG